MFRKNLREAYQRNAIDNMAEIKKLNLYLSEHQYRKLCILAEMKGVEPEQVANETVYHYLAIVDPYAIDYDDMTPEQRAAADREYEEWCRSEGLDP